MREVKDGFLSRLSSVCFIQTSRPTPAPALGAAFGQMDAKLAWVRRSLRSFLREIGSIYCVMGEGQLLPPSLPFPSRGSHQEV
jgi:hypothetical protein